MGKRLFSLLGFCCLSAFLHTNPDHQKAMEICQIQNKNTMAFCAIKYLQENHQNPLSMQSLTLDKPQLIRNVSDKKFMQMSQSLDYNDLEEVLVGVLIEEWCPASPIDKRRKMLTRSNSYYSSQDSLCSQLQDDCIVKDTPPTTPITKDSQSRATKQIDRLHRQWKTMWKSDNNLQAMLADSLHVGRKRSSSDQK